MSAPPKLFSLFNKPSRSIIPAASLESDALLIETPALSTAISPAILSAPSEAVDTVSSVVPAESGEESKVVQRKRAMGAVEEEAVLEGSGSSSRGLENITDGTDMVVSNDGEVGEVEVMEATARVSASDLFFQPRSSASVTTGAIKRKLGNNQSKKGVGEGQESDDEIIFVGSKGSPKGKGRTKKVKVSTIPASPIKKARKKATIFNPTASTSNIIVIPDSPPSRSSFSSSRASGFAPLSEVYRASREKRIANEPILPRWPTRDEHGFQHSDAIKSVRGGEGWKNFVVEKGKGKARDYTEEEQYQFLNNLQPRPSPSSSVLPLRHFDNPAQLVHYHPSEIKSLLPAYAPQPLLERLATPLERPNSSAGNFVRSHDRDNDEIMDAFKSSSSRPSWNDLWTDKYSPKSAAEVLGKVSGQSALILRDWLQELAVASLAEEAAGQKKGRKVTRGAKKVSRLRRADSELDDFIAYDDEEDDLLRTDSDSETDNTSTGSSQFSSLTNLILLSGPTASGKSSSVHAVAKELGWEVLECYPGQWKRNAKNIEKYTGDVGKNHITRNDVFSAFRKKESSSSTKVAGEQKEENKQAAQLLILFDEVDVLFKTEPDFWPALINVVKECKRPVVLTCSDLQAIPYAELGLQVISRGGMELAYLPYEAVEPEVAVPFLRLVALSEGHILPESNITSLYNLESPAPPTPSHFFKAHGDAYPSYQPLPCPDLRKALSQLQFECQWALGVSAVSWMDFNRIGREERTAWSRWKEVVTPAPSSDFCTVQVDSLVAAEALSFMDAHISRGTIDLIEEFEPTAFSEGDEEDSLYTTIPPPLPPARIQLPYIKSTDNVVSHILSRYGGRQAGDLDAWREDLALDSARLSNMSRAETIAMDRSEVIPFELSPRDPRIYTLYLPYLRMITEADDVQSAVVGMAGDESVGSGRLRRSMRFGATYQRKVPWSKAADKAIRESAFTL